MTSSRTVRKLCDVRDLMRDCYRETLTLQSHLSKFHFLRLFRDAYRETPLRYLRRRRLEAARSLLTRTDLSVTDICLRVGYESLGSFSTLFRRQVGVSPALFRRQVRSLITVPGRFPWSFVPICFVHHYGAGQPVF